MDLRAWACAALVAAAGAGCASKGGSPPAAEREYTQEEEMAAWMAVGNPGPEHARMTSECGEWTVASKMWMAPEAPAMEGTGSAKMHMIMDGRYQVMEYEGMMMPEMPSKGMGITGYDNNTKKYISTWCDSMGTMIMVSEGTRDPSGKTLTLMSDMVDPLGRKCVVRQVGTSTDADHMLWTFHCKTGSKPEFKMMELRLTREK